MAVVGIAQNLEAVAAETIMLAGDVAVVLVTAGLHLHRAGRPSRNLDSSWSWRGERVDRKNVVRILASVRQIA